MSAPVLVAFTRSGVALAARVQAALPGSRLCVAAAYTAAAGPVAEPFAGSPAVPVAACFAEGAPLVLFAAAGVAVRLIAPHLRSKVADPAVVSMDDAGRYAVCLLGGHGAGGNALARQVAAALGAEAVITTASERHGLPALDLLGQAWGWRREASAAALKRGAAALVNGEPIALFQDAGPPIEASPEAWGQPEAQWPQQFIRYPELAVLVAEQPANALVISDRALPQGYDWVVYRPPTLAAGIGCIRGAPLADLRRLLTEALASAGLAPRSLYCLASIDLKGDETGLLALGAELGLPLRLYAAAELAAVSGLPNPSEHALAAVGAPGVCESAAILAAGGGPLLVAKRKSASATVAIARRLPNGATPCYTTGGER